MARSYHLARGLPSVEGPARSTAPLRQRRALPTLAQTAVPTSCPQCLHGKPLPPGHRVVQCADCGRDYLVEDAPGHTTAPLGFEPAQPTAISPRATVRIPSPDRTFVEDEEVRPVATGAKPQATQPIRRRRTKAPVQDPRMAVKTEPGFVLNGSDLKAGLTLGGYKLLARIGAGGMGTVWLARQLSLDRNVAVKILRPSLASDPEFVIQFAREALGAAQLVHHNIAQIYDTGTEGQLHYFSMEYVEGESLSALLRREGKLDSQVAAGYVLQAARGLQFAHDRALIHRDVKPENLLLNRDGIVKVADLGLVMRTDAEEAALSRPVARARATKVPLETEEPKDLLGTPAFMAPEQASETATLDGRTDIYSLGCTLYNLVAGRAPFEADSAVAVLAHHLFDAPEPPEQHNRRVPAELSAIILKAMAKKPDERFQSMAELIDALEAFLGIDGSAVFSPREEHAELLERAVADFNRAPWAWRRRLLAAGLVLLVLGAGTAAVLLHHPKLAAAAAAFGLTAWSSALLVDGIAQRSTLLLRLRQLLLAAPLAAWLVVGVTLGTGVVSLAWLGLLRNALIGLCLAVLAGASFYFLVDRRLAQQRRPPLVAVEGLLKGMRLRGLEEQALRQFVCKYSGEDWEPLYEALFGYEAKLAARAKWGRDEKNIPRGRHGAWRDPLIGWLNRRLEARQRARAERHLATLEQTRADAG